MRADCTTLRQGWDPTPRCRTCPWNCAYRVAAWATCASQPAWSRSGLSAWRCAVCAAHRNKPKEPGAAQSAGAVLLEDANAQLEHQVELYRLAIRGQRGLLVALPGDVRGAHVGGLCQHGRVSVSAAVPIADHLRGLLPDDRAPLDAAAQAMDGRTIEYRWQHPDGHVLWVRSRMYRQMEQGVVRANVGVVQEVSSEKAAIKAARDQLTFIQKIRGPCTGHVV